MLSGSRKRGDRLGTEGLSVDLERTWEGDKD